MLASLDMAVANYMAQKVSVSQALDDAQREMQQFLDADMA